MKYLDTTRTLTQQKDRLLVEKVVLKVSNAFNFGAYMQV